MLLPKPSRVSETAEITNMGTSTFFTPHLSASLPSTRVPTMAPTLSTIEKVRLESRAYPASTISLGSQVDRPLTISRHMKKAIQIMIVPSARPFLNSAHTGLPASPPARPVNPHVLPGARRRR